MTDLQQARRTNIDAAADPDALLDIVTVCALTSMARSTVYQAVQHGVFPSQARRSRRFARWRAGDVRAWLRGEWTHPQSAEVAV
jgi:predicted DNA-binding transcriptional regulator AlpA